MHHNRCHEKATTSRWSPNVADFYRDIVSYDPSNPSQLKDQEFVIDFLAVHDIYDDETFKKFISDPNEPNSILKAFIAKSHYTNDKLPDVVRVPSRVPDIQEFRRSVRIEQQRVPSKGSAANQAGRARLSAIVAGICLVTLIIIYYAHSLTMHADADKDAFELQPMSNKQIEHQIHGIEHQSDEDEYKNDMIQRTPRVITCSAYEQGDEFQQLQIPFVDILAFEVNILNHVIKTQFNKSISFDDRNSQMRNYAMLNVHTKS